MVFVACEKEKAKTKEKTLDPRLLMSRMTGGEKARMTGGEGGEDDRRRP